MIYELSEFCVCENKSAINESIIHDEAYFPFRLPCELADGGYKKRARGGDKGAIEWEE